MSITFIWCLQGSLSHPPFHILGMVVLRDKFIDTASHCLLKLEKVEYYARSLVVLSVSSIP